jgi:hypothetical protein
MRRVSASGKRRRSAVLVLVGMLACASPVPRDERIAALEQRVAAQRARTAAVERGLAGLVADPPALPAADDSAAHYQLVTFRSAAPLGARETPAFRLQLAQTLAEARATAFEYDGVDGSARFAPPWENQEFPGVPLAVLFAAGQAASARFRGAEFDVRVPLEPGPDRWVTVIHELDGRIAAIDALVRDADRAANAADPGALRTRYGIGPVEGWSAGELASLEQALALLRPAELEALRELPFRRKSRASRWALPRATGRHCGHFQIDQSERAITIYDCAFETDAFAFVGPIERPLPPSSRVILHEVAHALASRSLADVLADAIESQREAEVMIGEFNRLGQDVPRDEMARLGRLQSEIQSLQASLLRWHEKLQRVDHLSTGAVRAFLAQPGASSGFTPYGRTHPVEAYAEAFSLCRTDAEAGQRIAPAVCAYFDSGEYLESGK